MTHTCPIRGCDRQVPDHQLLCLPHWRQTPHHLQRELYDSWARGRGAGSPRHIAAMRACVRAVEALAAQRAAAHPTGREKAAQ